MPFGDTAKKLQKVTSMAEDTYEKVNELYAKLNQLGERVDRTTEQVETIERDLAEQRALVEALAEQQGLDVDAVLAEHAASGGEGADADTGAGTGADPGTAAGGVDGKDATDGE